MEYYSTLKKNEIMSFFRKMEGTGDPQTEPDKSSSKGQILNVLIHSWLLDDDGGDNDNKIIATIIQFLIL
jgi:hypothetical protein